MAKPPKNARNEWLPADLKLIRQLAKQGTPGRVIAAKLGRTLTALYHVTSTEGISLKPPAKKNARRTGKK